MASKEPPYGDHLGWDEVQDLPTGDLVHLMLCTFDPTQRHEPSYMQPVAYYAAAEELNQRLKKAP